MFCWRLMVNLNKMKAVYLKNSVLLSVLYVSVVKSSITTEGTQITKFTETDHSNTEELRKRRDYFLI